MVAGFPPELLGQVDFHMWGLAGEDAPTHIFDVGFWVIREEDLFSDVFGSQQFFGGDALGSAGVARLELTAIRPLWSRSSIRSFRVARASGCQGLEYLHVWRGTRGSISVTRADVNLFRQKRA